MYILDFSNLSGIETTTKTQFVTFVIYYWSKIKSTAIEFKLWATYPWIKYPLKVEFEFILQCIQLAFLIKKIGHFGPLIVHLMEVTLTSFLVTSNRHFCIILPIPLPHYNM